MLRSPHANPLKSENTYEAPSSSSKDPLRCSVTAVGEPVCKSLLSDPSVEEGNDSSEQNFFLSRDQGFYAKIDSDDDIWAEVGDLPEGAFLIYDEDAEGWPRNASPDEYFLVHAFPVRLRTRTSGGTTSTTDSLRS